MDIINNLPAFVMLAFKLLIILGLSLYSLFAGIMVRQERLMDKVINETFEPVLRVLVLIHLVASVSLLIFAIVTL